MFHIFILASVVVDNNEDPHETISSNVQTGIRLEKEYLMGKCKKKIVDEDFKTIFPFDT